MRAVITAGGPIDGEYARLAGTNRKALAPVRGHALLSYALRALQDIGVDEIAVVGDDAVAAIARPWNVKMIGDGGSGGANILRALDAWPDDAVLLYLTCDMPYIDSTSLRWFIDRVDEKTLAMPLTQYDAYVERFPGAPDAGITLRGERVVNGGVFQIPAGARERIRRFATTLFEARKAPWKMARIAGAGTLLGFALGRASVESLEARARTVLGVPVAAVRNAPPELAFDADTEDDYAYAIERE